MVRGFRFGSNFAIVYVSGLVEPYFYAERKPQKEYTKANYEMTKDFYQFPQYNGKIGGQHGKWAHFKRPTK